MSTENANIFKVSMLRTYLEGSFEGFVVREIVKPKIISLILSGTFMNTFTTILMSDSNLDQDFENIKDDNGVAISNIRYATGLANKHLEALEQKYKVEKTPWWDSETSWKINFHFEIVVNCKDNNIKIINHNSVVDFVGVRMTLPLEISTEQFMIIVSELIYFYTNLFDRRDEILRKFSEEASLDYKNMIKELYDPGC